MKTEQTRRRFSAEEGFSLTEVLVVSVMLGIILGAAWLAMGTVSSASDGIMARKVAQDQGELAIERIVREFRMTQGTGDYPQPYFLGPTSNATTLIFYADVDHSGSLDRVTYKVTGGLLTRQVAQSTPPSINAVAANFGADSAPVTLAKVDPTLTTIFTYIDGNNLTGATPANTQAIKINLSTIGHSGASTITVSFPTAESALRVY
jgi:prepilin-type N-terminal cleavage/methylation domain-containing protein